MAATAPTSSTGTTPENLKATRSIARLGMLNVVAAGVGAALTFALTLVVTRGFGRSEGGAFFAETSLFIIVLTLVQMGTDQGLIWHLSHLQAWKRTRDISSALRSALLPTVLLSFVVLAIVLVFLHPLSDLVGNKIPNSQWVIFALILCLPLASLEGILVAAARGLGAMRPTLVIDQILLPAIQLLGILIVARVGGGLVALAGAWAAGYVITGMLAMVAVLRLRRRGARLVVPEDALPARPQRVVFGELWRNTVPRLWTKLCLIGLQRADIAIVGFAVSTAAANTYNGATRLVVLGQLGTQAVLQVAQPFFAQMLSLKNHASARSVYQTTTTWFVLGTWPLYLIGIVMAPELLAVFGHHFRTGSPVLIVLCIAMTFASSCGPVDTVLTMSGRPGLSLINFVIAFAIDLGLLVLLLPRWGIVGAGVAWATAIATRNLITLIQIKHLYGIHPICPPMIKACVANLVSFAAIPLLVRWATGNTWLTVAAIAIGTGLYAVFLYRWRNELQLEMFTEPLRRFGRKKRNSPTPGDATVSAAPAISKSE